jgi:FkbM family methyltransferase
MLRQLKAFGKRNALRLGVDIRGSKHTEEGILRNLLARVQPSAVLDVGANIGQYARKVRAAGYQGTIISFEALESAHRALTQNARSDPAWKIAPCGVLGGHAGMVDINVASNSASSSVLPLTSLLRGAAPQAAYVGKQSSPCMRLDAYDGFPPSGLLYLKIDTQGFELEVLRGASALLPRIGAIQLELSLVALYEGAPVMTDMILYLEERGFELFQIAPGFRDERDGRLLQAEGFFVQRPTHTG